MEFFFERTANADRDRTFNVFTNYENYLQLVPDFFPSVRVRSVRNNTAIVEERMVLGGREFLIMAKHVSENPVSHEIFIVGGDVKGSHIRQEFVRLGDDQTKILVNVRLNLGIRLKILCVFGECNLEQGCSDVLDAFVRAAEN